MKRERVYTIIQVGNLSDIPSRTYDYTLMAAVLLNLFIAIFDTFPISEPYQELMQVVETLTVLFFCADYVLRIWTADLYYESLGIYLTPSRARVRFAFSWVGLVDLFSCAPFFLPMGSGAHRMFRIVRILRVFRVHHYADPLHIIGDVINKKKGQLLSSTFIVLVLMITASLLMYSLEHEAQPEAFANAFSGFWWAANTLLTVGYGDVVPLTFAGRICGTCLTFLGVGMVAIPTGILSAGFMEQVSGLRTDTGRDTASEWNPGDVLVPQSKGKEPFRYCPYCGHSLQAEQANCTDPKSFERK